MKMNGLDIIFYKEDDGLKKKVLKGPKNLKSLGR